MKKSAVFQGFVHLALGMSMLSALGQAQAEPYPNGPVRVIVPYSPGGPPDAHARYIADQLAKRLEHSFVVENRGGAGGTIAVSELLRNRADGQTLLLFAVPLSLIPGLYPSFKPSIQDDLVPVAQLSWQYNILVVPPSLGVSSVEELVAKLRAMPGHGNYASGGPGTPAHLLGEMFSDALEVTPTHVPYNVFTQAIVDTSTGQTQFMFAAAAGVVGHIQAGRLNALAVVAPERLPSLPDVPTMKELGYEEVDMLGWTAIAAKAGTDPIILDTLRKEMGEILATADAKAYFAQLGDEAAQVAPRDFSEFFYSEAIRWTDYVRSKGISIQ